MLRAVKQGASLPTVMDVQRRLGLGQNPAQEGADRGRLAGYLAGSQAREHRGRNSEVTTCREQLHYRSDTVGRVGLEPTTGRL